MTLSFTERNNKIALWVQTDKTTPINIWDLSKKELTPEVKNAIAHALQRGYEIAQEEIKQSITTLAYSNSTIKIL